MTFSLIVLRHRWADLNLGYRAAQAIPILTALDPEDALYAVTLREIEIYDWDRQTIALTEAATEELGRALAMPDAIPGEVKAVTDMKRNLGWGNAIESALYTRGFVVRVGGEPLYGGIFLDAISQMGIDYPVARVTMNGSQAVVSLLPIQIPFAVTDPIDGRGARREVSIPPEARADVQQLTEQGDSFGSWLHGIATSERANQFRKQIRDSRIRTMLESTGKVRG